MRRTHQPSVESFIEQEDKLAEEEMLKIARRRKNLDEMARELDRLNERAYPKEKMSPPHAMKAVGLNIFERGEIVDYKEVYFCGTKDAKKHVGDLNTQNGANFGYDDDRGDYAIVPGDHLAYRYEIIDVLGKGSFGQVVRCIDHKTGGLVAIKIIRNKKRFHQQALVEVNILQKLREWDPNNQYSLVSFVQSFYFRGHLCISTELLGMNLYEFIKSNDFRGFSLRLIRTFTRQMLGSLILLKQHRVIHCDLKPENILLAHPAKTEIKVIDFGSSCFENEKVYTYIQSRFYRSPEVILGMSYGLPIDMWSLGCILAELFTGYPIFPGENEQEQLACIMEVFGPPERHLIDKSTRRKLFFDSFNKPRTFISAKGRRRKPSSKSLRQALKCEDEPFLDFVARCLRWDPDKRMKPEEALKHSFITGVRMSAPPRSRGFDSSSASSRFSSRNYGSPATTSTASASRPLPEPPAATTGVKPRVPASPLKSTNSHAGGLQSSYGSQSKRNSIVGGSTVSLNTVGGIKRTSTTTTSTGAGVGSNLPRMAAGRPGSGKIPTPP
ncbi:kinase-like protein [Ascobolus immersus RN42]|uniref:dual-specificity kinase n=1 Tax=Ascobolus immersus RN42 TaxID=1160509 RepID=A0A3N4HNN6_ASCIM|nr:kinase-like protein [Ascobolus immersus RN42]